MVRWEDFSKRRKIKLADISLDYEGYCKYCKVRGVLPVNQEIYNLQSNFKPIVKELSIQDKVDINRWYQEEKELRESEIVQINDTEIVDIDRPTLSNIEAEWNTPTENEAWEYLSDPEVGEEIIIDEFVVEKPLEEMILPPAPDWSKINKRRKTDIQSLCYDCGIDYEETDTKRTLISKLKKEYGVK